MTNQKKNYHYLSEKILLDVVKNYNYKPSLLIHVCCGPCSVFPLKFLSNFFELTVYFYNPNIFPENEFNKRYETLLTYIKYLKDSENIDIKVVKGTYNHAEYMKDLIPYKDQKEGLDRCKLCYKKRILEAFNYAKDNNYDYITTVMTSSRQKDSNEINKIAEEITKNYTKPVYFFSDFKKHAWSEKGYKKAKDIGLYLQEYCGCEFSLNNKDE